MIRFITILFVYLSFLLSAFGEQVSDLKQYVVEIRTQDKTLIGTGTVISFTGLILTARHVLYDGKEAGSQSPNYLATVLVSFVGTTDLEPADLIAVHPYLDIAVLQLRSATRTPIPAKMETSPKTLGESAGKQVAVIGHVIETGELDQVLSANINSVDRHGHIILNQSVRTGTSGGPVFMGDKLIGVVRNTGVNSTTVVPIARAIEYLSLVGVFFSENGAERRTGDIAGLAAKVQRYETTLGQIERDLSWTADMSEEDSPPPDTEAKLQLTISFQRKLRIQPPLEAIIKIVVVPLFRGDQFENVSPIERSGFEYSGVRIKDKPIRFDDVRQDLETVVEEYKNKKNLVVSRSDIIGFDIKAWIYGIKDTGYAETPPKPSTVCFSLRADDKKTPPLLRPTPGDNCGDEFKYVDLVAQKLGT
jgi:Trypsin-like peptidase domain